MSQIFFQALAEPHYCNWAENLGLQTWPRRTGVKNAERPVLTSGETYADMVFALKVSRAAEMCGTCFESV